MQGIRSDRVPEELWTEVRDMVHKAGIKTIPKKMKCKKAKWLSEEALQIAVKRREVHWRRKWQPTPLFLPGESQGRRSLVGCRLWGRTESDTTEAT